MVAVNSPKLCNFLQENAIEIEFAHWDGTPSSIPIEGDPVIVRASSQMQCSVKALAQRCAISGHFLFYDDAVILPDGTYSKEKLLPEAQKFLDTLIVHHYGEMFRHLIFGKWGVQGANLEVLRTGADGGKTASKTHTWDLTNPLAAEVFRIATKARNDSDKIIADAYEEMKKAIQTHKNT